MNKNYFKFSALLLAGSLIVSCSKDDEQVAPTNEPEFPTEFSELTVEQNKEKLEDNGIQLVDKVTNLKNTGGIQASIAFSKHVDGSKGLDNLEGGRQASNHGTGVARLLAAFGEGKSSTSQTLAALRVAEDDFTSFQDEFNSAKGIYTYNKANDTWAYQATGDKVVFKFPSKENGTTNNAEYSIFDYKGTTISGGLGGDDYKGDYPTSLKIELTVDGNKKMGYSFAAAYDSKGTPTNVSLSIEIDSYKFAYDVTNTTTEVKVNYALTEGGNNLVALGASSTGNFNSDVINNSDGPEEVFNTGSAYFQIMNIKFSSSVDFDKLASDLDKADTDELQSAAWNSNLKLLVYYADSKKKIADSEFYVVDNSYSYEDCYTYYNQETEQDEQICNTYEYVDKDVEIKMVFADGSKSDLAAYTDAGFAEFSDKLEAFFDDIEND
jgi:hypothetical protein